VPEEQAISKRTALALALAALVTLGGLAIVLGGGSDSSGGQSLESVEGILTEVESDRLVLEADEPLDGQSEVEFVVRIEDAAALDLRHLEVHAADRLPTRVYYEKSGGELYAVRAEDAPVGG
jgi:hypothetical protein